MPLDTSHFTIALAVRRSELGQVHVDRFLAILNAIPGCSAFAVVDGDRRGLSSDLLILFRNARQFHGYARLLRSTRANRPIVAVWQLDPLPPPELDPGLEADALDRLRFSRLTSFSRLIAKARLGRIYKAIQQDGIGPHSLACGNDGVDIDMIRTVIEAHAFIHHGLAEGWIDRVFATTAGKQKFLADRGIASPMVPAGYDETYGENYHRTRDIDVVFIGRLTKSYRRSRIEAIERELSALGLRCVIVGGNCHGEERTALLNNTKLVLHLHKYPWDTPWARWGIASSCGAAVISEPLRYSDPFKPGVHYLEAPYDNLSESIALAVREPDKLQEISQTCLSLMKKKTSAQKSLNTIVANCLTDRQVSV